MRRASRQPTSSETGIIINHIHHLGPRRVKKGAANLLINIHAVALIISQPPPRAMHKQLSQAAAVEQIFEHLHCSFLARCKGKPYNMQRSSTPAAATCRFFFGCCCQNANAAHWEISQVEPSNAIHVPILRVRLRRRAVKLWLEGAGDKLKNDCTNRRHILCTFLCEPMEWQFAGKR